MGYTQDDLKEGLRLQDEGVAKVDRPPFRDEAHDLIKMIAHRQKFFTADDVRFEAERVGLEPDGSRNAWSAAFRRALREGIMFKTSDRFISWRTAARGREVPVYRSLSWE